MMPLTIQLNLLKATKVVTNEFQTKTDYFRKIYGELPCLLQRGGSLGATVEAPTRPELLKKMEQLCLENKDKAEVVTFEPIKKIIEIKEAKGKFTVFRPIKTFVSHFTHKSLRRFYNEV